MLAFAVAAGVQLGLSLGLGSGLGDTLGPATDSARPARPAGAPAPADAASEDPSEEAADKTPDLEIEIGARIVIRPEARTNESFGVRSDDTSWRIRQGARLNTAMRYRFVRMVLQVQDVREWGEATNTLSLQDSVGAHQAFVEVAGQDLGRKANTSAYLRLGRQEVKLWTRRILGESPWQPSSRAFDAARGRVDVGRFGVEAGAIVLRAPRSFNFQDGNSVVGYRTQGEQLYWAETSFAAHPAFNVHAASFVLRQQGTESQPNRDRTIVTPGLYFHGKPIEGLKYELDAYYQVGADSGTPHRAWAAAALAGYTFKVAPKPSLHLGYEVASGAACTQDPTGGQGCDPTVDRGFDQHFGARHLYRGHADLFAQSNVRDLRVRAGLTPSPVVRFFADYHHFSLYESRGAWTNTGGNLVGQGWDSQNTQHTLGHEIDLLVDYRPSPQLQIRPGYALFIPTGAGRTLGGDETQHFVYLWLVAQIGHVFHPG